MDHEEQRDHDEERLVRADLDAENAEELAADRAQLSESPWLPCQQCGESHSSFASCPDGFANGVVALNADAVIHLSRALHTVRREARVAIDGGGLKISIDGHTWSLPFGELTQ